MFSQRSQASVSTKLILARGSPRPNLATFGLLLLISLTSLAHAATRTWTGAVSSDWFAAGNWQPAGVPAASDSVTIANGAVVDLSHDSPVTDLNLNGTLNGIGALTISGTMNWTAGDIRAQIVVATSGKLNISGAANKGLPAGTIKNAGTIVWTGTGAIIGYSDAKIENSGTFEAQNDGLFTFCCASPLATFHNLSGGTFRKRNSSGETTIGDFILVNEGAVDIQSGTLILRTQNHQLKAGGRFSGAGRTAIVSGTTTLSGISRIETGGTIEFRSGTVAGVGGFNGPGAFEWTSGDLVGALTIEAGTRLNISGDANRNIPGGVLNIAGTAVWTGKGAIIGYSNGKINNTGTFEVRDDSSFTFCCSEPLATFNNTGQFLKTGGTNVTVINNFILNNGGQVKAQTGTIAVGGGTSSGTFTADAKARIEFTTGTHTLTDGASFDGQGVSRVRGGTVTLKGQTTLQAGSTFDLGAGVINGAGTFQGAGQFNWSGGEISALVTIAPAGRMNITGSEPKNLNTGKLNNLGTIMWDGAGAIVGYSGGAITNSALFEMHNDASFFFCCSEPIATFVNLPAGILRKTQAPGETAFSNFLLVNQGTVDVQSGVLALRGPQHQLNAGGRFAGGGRTRLLTAVVIKGASSIASGATVELAASSGTLGGDGAFDGLGTFEWTGGDLIGKLSLGATLKWLISGEQNKMLPAGVVNSAGAAIWTGSGKIVGYSGGQINNSGLFEVQNDSAAEFCCADPRATLHNLSTGKFRKTGGPGQTTFNNFFFNNDGLVEVLKGTLVLAGGGTSSGIFSNAPSANITFGAGTMVFANGANSTIGGLNKIGPGATVTLNSPLTLASGGRFQLAGGTLNGIGTMNGPGTFEWSEGDLQGELSIASETKMQITGPGNKNLVGGKLQNQGTITWTGTGVIDGYAGGSITNNGVFEMQNDSTFVFCCADPIATFNNGPKGTIRKTIATGESAFTIFVLQNEGLIDIQTGILVLRNQTHLFKHGGRFSGAGRTRIESAVNISGTSTLEAGGTVELAGTIVGDGTFAGTGTLEWTRGELDGKLAIARETTMLISSSVGKNIPAGVLNNAGHVIWTGTGGITGYAKGVINNTGVFDIKNDTTFNFCCADPIATFFNRAGGLLRKTSKAETAFQNFSFVNEGRLSIQAGTLRLSDGTIIVGVCPVKIPAAVSIDLLPSNTQAVITWTHGGIEDGGDNLSFGGFEIEKSTAGGPFQQIATPPAGTFKYEVAESCDGPLNSYRIRASSDGCNSGYSTSVSIPRPTEPPTFTSKAQQLAAAEKPFVYDAVATDPHGAKVVYVLLKGPPGMKIDALSGKVQWAPPSAMRGQIIPVTLMAFNGACGAKGTQDFTLAIGETPPPGGFKLRVGKVVMSADSLFRVAGGVGLQGRSAQRVSPSAAGDIEDGTYQVGGDIQINDYVSFTGSVVVTLNKAAATLDVKVDQGKVYLTNIPFIGKKTIWEGGQVAFTVDGNGEITKLLQVQLARPLQAAGMDIAIERAKLLLDGDLGIRIFGKLNFPDVYGITALSAKFDNLEISRNSGVRFTGVIHLSDFELGGMGVRNVTLNWVSQEDPTKDVFEGEGELKTPAFEVACKVVLVAGGLDGVYGNVDIGGFGIPVPPGPAPFLNITGGGIGVEGLRSGPFSVRLDVNVTLVHPAVKNIISLNKAGITYTYPSHLKGSADLRILTAKAAKAYLDFDLPYRFGLGGKIDLIESFPVLLIEADMAAGVDPDPLRFFFEGGASGKLQIPPYDNFPDGIKKAFPPLWLAKPFLPKTLAQASIAYRNSQFSTSLDLPVIGELVVAVKYGQNQVQFLVGQNLSSLTKIIGLGSVDSVNGVDVRDPVFQKSMLAAKSRDRASMGGGNLEGDGLFIPRSLTPRPQTLASVTVPPNAPRVIFRVFSELGAPRYQLVKPDGSRLTPESTGGAVYQQSPDTKESYFVVTTPAAGSWKVEAEGASKGPFVLDAWGANAPPVLTSVSATQNGGNVTIDYNAADPDDNAMVALFYDTDSAGFNGGLIVDKLPASTTGRHIWNTAGANLPSGTYSIYAIVDDEKNVPVQRYAAGTVTIVDPNAPTVPKNVKAQPGGENSLLLTWDANTETNLRGYQIRYAEDTNGVKGVLSEVLDAGKTNAFRMTKLKNETTYRIDVAAYTQNEEIAPGATTPTLVVHRSIPSEPVTAKTEIAKAPNVRITSPNGGERVAQNSSINISWKLDDADDVVDQQVELSSDGGQTWRPLAKHLAPGKRNYSWDVPSGLQSSRTRIRVSALDRAGNEGIDASDANFTVAGLDSDGDGLPDDWEIANGFDPNAKGDEALDSDGDGLTNLQEYLAGTNPKDAASAFRVIRAAPFADGIQITFSTVANKAYRLERSDNIAGNIWTVVEDNIAGTGENKQVVDVFKAPSNARFYRVRLLE